MKESGVKDKEKLEKDIIDLSGCTSYPETFRNYNPLKLSKNNLENRTKNPIKEDINSLLI